MTRQKGVKYSSTPPGSCVRVACLTFLIDISRYGRI
nr:MAG TPA: hypothetical protein [Caudoviricetes sp.]